MSQIGLGPNDPTVIPVDYIITGTGASAFNYTPLTSTLVIDATGTITSGTVTFPTNPVNGQRLRIVGKVAVTTLTCTAGPGDAILSTAAALVANVGVEWVYTLAGAVNVSNVVTNARSWIRLV
jgi:hypothetical protein